MFKNISIVFIVNYNIEKNCKFANYFIAIEWQKTMV